MMASIRTLDRLSLAMLVLLLMVGGALVAAAAQIAANRAYAQLSDEAAQSSELLDALLSSEIEHYRALPLTLASDAQVAGALASADTAARAILSDRLAQLSRDIGSAAVYLIGADGITVAASNAREPGSFVGVDYRFRQYFRAAMRDGRGLQFALGSTTRRPGLYLSQRVDSGGRPIGVIVVKVEFNALESNWKKSGSIAVVTDARGEILITTEPVWRFRLIADLLPEAKGGAMLHQLKLPNATKAATFSRAVTDTVVPGWRLHALLATDDRVASAVAAAAAVTALSLATGGGLLFWLVLRQRRVAVRALEAEQARTILEQRVAARTAELSEANARLVEEMAERHRVEEAARLVHEELEQANRLAILGQIAAGVTHEINQPVAAIRTYADNADVLIGKGQTGPARSAIGRIAKLTERIGAITGELRAFSAKRGGRARLLGVDTAIDGALQLLGSNLRQANIQLDRAPRDPDIKVWAEKIRVEQILVNLLRNAIDALADTPEPVIRIGIAVSGSSTEIVIADNGPGIDAEVAALLFTPFRTTKSQGLGLGLVISRDIAASMGGELNLLPPDTRRGCGAAFALRLPGTQP